MDALTTIKFQFHKGTIKTLSLKRCNILRMFQFHKGTIKTRCREQRQNTERSFQFHKGTIKT